MQVFVFIVIFGLNTADMVSDWFLFHDVDAAEEGLVFGPPDRKIWCALLAFSILGSVILPLEILNLGKDIFTSNPWVDIDVMSVIIIWLEDIPQITINCVILACREEAISVFQISKASVVILGAVVRMLIGIVRACRRDQSTNMKKLKQCNTFKGIMFTGFILMVCGSVAVFMFAQSSFAKDGRFEFKTPRNIWDGEYNDERYFDRVGVYVNMGFLDDNTRPKHPSHSHWMKLFNIHDIHHENEEIVVNVTFESELRQNFRIQTTFNALSQNASAECYRVNQTSWEVFGDQNCSDFTQQDVAIETIVFKFRYVKPRNHLILGDIQYNVRGSVNGSCGPSSRLRIIPTDMKADKVVSPVYQIVLRYFQAQKTYRNEGHLIGSQNSHVMFYSSKRHLVDINDVWKTGFLGCENTGSVSPHLNTNIPVTC